MSRPPTMSQLLKRAGLARRPRIDPSSKQKVKKARPRSNGAAAVDGSSEDGAGVAVEAEDEGLSDIGSGATADEAVDDQIAALERELNGGDDSSDEESSSSSGSEDSSGDTSDDDDNSGEPTKLVSPLEADKIEPLPAHLLPQPGCGAPMVVKKKKPKVTRAEADAAAAAAGPSQSKGLDSAVKELLANYEARSSERVPFYCRVCQFQGDSLEALQRHKEEPLHVEATKKERKISSCSLCKKQFTSPPQLKEHLAGKAHLERLQAVMSRQGKWVPGGRAGGGGRGGRGGRGQDGSTSNGFSIRESGSGGDYSHSGSATGRGRGRGGREGGRGGRDGGRGRWGRAVRGRGPGRGSTGRGDVA